MSIRWEIKDTKLGDGTQVAQVEIIGHKNGHAIPYLAPLTYFVNDKNQKKELIKNAKKAVGSMIRLKEKGINMPWEKDSE